ncbi:MAG: hypothetical protein U9Q98_06675 [Bacteroidota bacterium]|nr:hypothetical protein [Bacteroidota bacterium]
MPYSEMLMKDINYVFLACYHWLKNGFKTKTILVYPHYPSRRSTIYSLAKQLNYNVTNRPHNKFDFAIYWEYLTFRKEFEYLESIARHKKVINLYSRDISKKTVDQAVKSVFGYSTFINPLIYKGKIVKKNDINAIHDGTVLNGPVDKKEDGYIYQVLINNTTDDGMVVDIRVPIIFGALSFVYEKFKPEKDRFGHPATSHVRNIHDMLSDKEIQDINRFCEHTNLEFGELDVLRDRDSGKIFIVDVNNTPQFQSKLSPSDRQHALHKMADALKRNTHGSK